MLATKQISRRARPRVPRELTITPRDLEILKLLSRYKFLGLDDIHALIGGNIFALQARLRELTYAHLIFRPKQQWDFFNSNYRPAIYQLDVKGAELLEHRALVQKPQAFFKHLHNEFAHNVMLCDVLASIEVGAKAKGIVIKPFAGEIKIPVQISLLIKRKLVEKLHYSKTPLIPDAVFALVYPDGKQLHFALEVDCGNEPLEAPNLERSSYQKKMLQYDNTLLTGSFKEVGIPQLLVLHVTNTDTRMQNIKEMFGGAKSYMYKVHPVIGDYTVNPDGQYVPAKMPAYGAMFGSWERVGHPNFEM